MCECHVIVSCHFMSCHVVLSSQDVMSCCHAVMLLCHVVMSCYVHVMLCHVCSQGFTQAVLGPDNQALQDFYYFQPTFFKIFAHFFQVFAHFFQVSAKINMLKNLYCRVFI